MDCLRQNAQQACLQVLLGGEMAEKGVFKRNRTLYFMYTDTFLLVATQCVPIYKPSLTCWTSFSFLSDSHQDLSKYSLQQQQQHYNVFRIFNRLLGWVCIFVSFVTLFVSCCLWNFSLLKHLLYLQITSWSFLHQAAFTQQLNLLTLSLLNHLRSLKLSYLAFSSSLSM